MRYREINFDGLVGPTHNYAGLSTGNLASQLHRGDRSNPRSAALQGLEKAMTLGRRGFPQAILPPPARPEIRALRNWGFAGKSDEDVLAEAGRSAPQLLAAAASASAMWTANACTMTPSCDSRDGRAHFSPANLNAKLHRSIEPGFTHRLLSAIFDDEERFSVHPPLSGGDGMADEGAANHTRFCQSFSAAGLHLFVFGRSAILRDLPGPRHYPARQTLESCQSIARRHGIPEEQSLFLQQSPAAVDAGVFHNDVISVGHLETFLVHEDAFLHQPDALSRLQDAYFLLTDRRLQIIEVPRDRVSLREAVRTYLFNSQLLEMEPGRLLLVVPSECTRSKAVSTLLETYLRDPENPVSEVLSFNLHESMRNGGGPACLRQRIVLSANEERHLRGRILLDEALCQDLTGWVMRHYRDHLSPADLGDPRLLEEVRTALDELSGILHLPDLYQF